MKHCDNCNKDFDSNYCPDCGSTGKEISEENKQEENAPQQPISSCYKSPLSYITKEEIIQLNQRRKKRILKRVIIISSIFIIGFFVLIFLGLFDNSSDSILHQLFNKNNPEGVYVGNQQSVIVLRSDGTGDYCYENSPIYENDLSWKKSDSRIEIYSSRLNYTIFLPLSGTELNSQSIITSDSTLWVCESFIKISNSPTNLSVSSAKQLVQKKYGSLIHSITSNSIKVSIPADFSLEKNNVYSYKNDSFIYFLTGTVPSSISLTDKETALDQISTSALNSINITGQYSLSFTKTINTTNFSKKIYEISCTNWNLCDVFIGLNITQNTYVCLVFVSKGEEKTTDFFTADANFLFDRLSAYESSYTTPSKNDSNVSSSIKSVLSEYEAFVDEYVAFMKKYKANPYDVTILSNYASMLEKYQKLTNQINALDQKSMTAEELLLYTQTLSRCAKKIAAVAY